MEPSRQPDGRKLVDLAGAIIVMFVVFASGVLFVLRGKDYQDSTAAPTTATQQHDRSARTTGTTRDGSLTVGGQSLLPVPDDLSAYVGRQAEGKRVEVQSVVERGGFWVGRSQTDRVYVKHRRDGGDNESTFDPNVADKVNPIASGPRRSQHSAKAQSARQRACAPTGRIHRRRHRAAGS